MRKTAVILLLLFIGHSISSSAQQQLDSLWGVWSDTDNADTIRLASLNTLITKKYLFAQPDTAFTLLEMEYNLAHSNNRLKWMAAASSLQGVSFHLRGNYSEAMGYYNRSLKHAEKGNDQKMIANTLNNIGIIYKEQEAFDQALIYFKKSYKIKKKIGDKRGFSNSLGNIGSIYDSQNEGDLAIDYYNRGLRIQEEMGNKRGIAGFLNNIGSILVRKGRNVKALEYLNRSLVLREEIGDMRGQASCLRNLSTFYYGVGEVDKAIFYAQKGLAVSKRSGAIQEEMGCARVLYKSYKFQRKDAKALEMYELYVQHKDTIGSEKNQQAVLRQTYQYEYDKQHLSDSLAFVQKQEIKDVYYLSQLDKEQSQRYFLYGGMVFLLVLGGFIFKGYQGKKKDHQIIERAHEVLEEKNREIMDSITYAKRIQSAILPPLKVVKEYLEDSFVLYLPKDIVAGDFYWMQHQQDVVLFAAADCTGHGVPGAMVSVVCNNALNRSVREHGLVDPGEILTQTREIVIQEFAKSDEDVKDGMDIALCSLSTNSKKEKVLKYAGANNPLWIIRNGVLLETKADKQPIGQYDNPKPYVTHEINLEKEDSIYIFSDGFVDQFGGEKGKKLKAKEFKELLLGIQEQTMEEQLTILSTHFYAWKGDLEQVDDVCVMGVRI